MEYLYNTWLVKKRPAEKSGKILPNVGRMNIEPTFKNLEIT